VVEADYGAVHLESGGNDRVHRALLRQAEHRGDVGVPGVVPRVDNPGCFHGKYRLLAVLTIRLCASYGSFPAGRPTMWIGWMRGPHAYTVSVNVEALQG
jgi:hypothetical protein